MVDLECMKSSMIIICVATMLIVTELLMSVLLKQ
jgi:hypothetical protein